jgi:hypothetical protein
MYIVANAQNDTRYAMKFVNVLQQSGGNIQVFRIPLTNGEVLIMQTNVYIYVTYPLIDICIKNFPCYIVKY